MALEIGQVAGGYGVYPVRRSNQAPGDAVAAIETELGAPEQQEQAPPLTGVAGVAPLSSQAIQALQGTDPSADTGEDGEEKSDGQPGGDLTEEEEKVVDELKKRDQEVRRHEAAHAAAGGQYAGTPTFTYEAGPDGQRYAVGGEVSIDTSPGSTPEETSRKADQIRAAALAPADPSGQDRAVAAAAAKMKLDAQAEATKQDQEELEAKETERKAEEPALPGQTEKPTPSGKAEEPTLPGQKKTEEKGPEIVGPKPVGQKDEEGVPGTNASSGGGPSGSTSLSADGRFAAAAGAYQRTDDSVSRTSRTAANALSLVA